MPKNTMYTDKDNGEEIMIEKNNSLPLLTKLKHFGSILKTREKIIIYIATMILILSLVGGSVKYYFSATKVVPATGGEYTEGIPIDSAGLPTAINPILDKARPIDQLLSSVVYSSLFTYDTNGQLVDDLVENYEISDDGKKYTLHLRENVFWHDGETLTAEDVVFTINLLQDSNYNPVNPKEWNAEKIKVSNSDNRTVIFDLSEPYAPFLSKLTFGILPKHLWSEVPSDRFSLIELNLKPVGSGPFVFNDTKKNNSGDIISYKLIANKKYYGKKPFLEKLILKFYQNQEAVIQAYSQREISGFSFSDYNKIADFKDKNDTSIYSINLPQYFSILLNQTESVPLADIKVRQALQYATNRDELIEKVFNGYAEKIYSPLIKPFITEDFNYNNDLIKFSPQDAERLLDEAGWKKVDGSEFRKKDDTELKIQLISTDVESLTKTVDLIKEQWNKVGINVELVKDVAKLNIKQKYLNPRKYESLLLGLEYSGNDPNLFFFWHSTGKKDPGLNFALYDNEKVDKLLEESKKTVNASDKNKKYIEISNHLIEDSPALFLYSPKYIYVLNKKIKGVDIKAVVKTTSRFNKIIDWYTKTKRIKK